MKGRNQVDMWIMRRMAKIAMVLVITAIMITPSIIMAQDDRKTEPKLTALTDPSALTIEGNRFISYEEVAKKDTFIERAPVAINKDTKEELTVTRQVETILSMGFEDPWDTAYDPDGDYASPAPGWDVDGLCICSQPGYPQLTHYWYQYDASMYPLPHSGDYCAGLWWSDENCGDVEQNEWIITPALDLSNYENVVLTFYGIWNWEDAPGWGDHYMVEISDDGVVWHGILDVLTIQKGTGGPAGYGWCWNEYQVVVDISENISNLGLNPANIYIAWHSYSDGDTLSAIQMLDDVEITGEIVGPPVPPELKGNDIAIIDLTLDGKSIQVDKGGCNRFKPGKHIPDVEVINRGNVSWVYPKPEGMPDENWAGKKATFGATIWREIEEVEWESNFEDNILGDWEVIDVDGKCCDWWNRTSERVHSGNYAMKVSRYHEYMPCAFDILQTRKPNDMTMYDEGYFEFWFWVEGDYAEGRYAVPFDYGYVQVSYDGGNTWETLSFEIYRYDPSLGTQVKIRTNPFTSNPDGTVSIFYSMEDQFLDWNKELQPDEWLKAKVKLENLTDKIFFRFIWISDCFLENEGWYIDDVRKIGIIHQGEVIWQAFKQVNLTAGETKHIQFEYPDLELYGEKHKKHVYWYMVEFKNIDDNASNDIKKDSIIIEDLHDVGVVDLTVEPEYQQVEIKSDLIPVWTNVTIQNFGTYVEENIPVELEVWNLKYEVVYFEDFEEGAIGWEHFTFGGPDLWHRTSRDAYSGQWSLGCFEEDIGFYDNNMYWDCVISPVIDFEKLGAKDAWLSFYAKWALEYPNDSWMIVLYDPTSYYILGHGPLATYYSRDIGYEIHHPDWKDLGEPAPSPEWWGPSHNWGYGQGAALGGDFFKRSLFDMMDYWRNAYPGLMFKDGYKCAVGFAIYRTDATGYIEPDMPEKWSGLFIDDVEIKALIPNNLEYNETKYIEILEDQNSTAELSFRWCPMISFGNFEVEVRTDLPIDQNPDNDLMDGYTHSYLIKWLDPVEYEKDPKTGQYIHEWTTEDLTTEKDTHWHIEPVKCGHYNVLACGYWDAYGRYHYGNNWDESVQPCDAPFDLSMVEGVMLEFDLCTEIETGYDYFYVEISPDGGQTWKEIYRTTGSECWKHVELPIYATDYEGNPQLTENFVFRFRFTSDELVYSQGVFIDNVILEEIEADYDEPQPILFENFTGPPFPPVGWEEHVYGGTGHWEARSVDGTWRDPPNADGLYAIADSDAHYCVVYDVGLRTPPIDLSGETNVTLDVDIAYENFAGIDHAYINVYSGGVYEEELAHWNTDMHQFHFTTTFDPSGYNDPSSVQIEFYYTTMGDCWLWFYSIDNVQVSTPGGVVFFEDFGDFEWPGHGWTVIQTTTEVNWYPCWWSPITYDYTSPPYSAGLWWGYQPQDEWLISPPLNFSMPYQYILRFNDWNFGEYPGYWEGDYVKISTDGGVTWTTLANLYEEAPPYPGRYWGDQLEFDLTMFAGNPDVRIAFHRWANQPGYPGNLGIWFIDDVEVIAGGYTPGDEIRWIFNDDFEFGWKWCTPHAPKDLWHVQEAEDEPEVPYGEGERPPYSEALNGSQFWACEKQHNEQWTYMNLMDNVLISPELSLYQAYAAKLVFWAYGILPPDYDTLFVSVRRIVDGEPQEWETPYVVELLPGWNEYQLDLQPWLGPDSVIQIAFRFISDYYNEYGALGVEVDDIKLDIKPDTTPPVTECKLSGPMGKNGYYTGAVTVELIATDDISGVYQTWYRVDGGEWTLYTGRFQVTADCDHVVEFYSIDNVGNVEEVKSCSFKIDATPPSVSIITPAEGYIYLFGRQLFKNPLGGTIVIGKITFEASASDAKSGVEYVHFEVNGFTYDDLTSPYQAFWHNFDLLPKKYTLTVTAYDLAGNKGADVSIEFLHWL